MDKRKVILDIDTGSDDAAAIILALLRPEFDVIGMCTVNGNREVKLTTENTLRVKQMMGVDVPVYKGCEFPLVATLTPDRKPNIPWREGMMTGVEALVHGDYLEFLEPAKIKEEDESAVAYYLRILNEAAKTGEKITLIPVGPLTNVATALRADPRIVDGIEEIMIMGGNYLVGNSSANSEYNIWVDPEAGEIVQQSGCKITWVPLDATHEAYITVAEAKEIRAIGNRAADAVASIVEQRTKGYSNDADMAEYGGAPIHDALAVLALVDPAVLSDVKHVHVKVDFAGGYSDGQTCVDMRERTTKPAPNAYFAFHANRERFVELVIETLKLQKD